MSKIKTKIHLKQYDNNRLVQISQTNNLKTFL